MTYLRSRAVFGFKIIGLAGSVCLLLWLLVVLTQDGAVEYTMHNLWRYDVLHANDLEEEPSVIYRDPPTVGFPCSGLLPQHPGFGAHSGTCPKGWAIIANVDAGSSLYGQHSGNEATIHATCCRLPFDDILTDEHLFNIADRCPDNYVFTSSTGEQTCGDACVARCTKINTQKYSLGPARPAYYFKTSSRRHYRGFGWAKRVMREQLPAAIRWAVGRASIVDTIDDGCVGMPFGSLLTGKAGPNCGDYSYRPLRYKDGSAVRIFPDCAEVRGLDTAFPTCVNYGRRTSG